MRHFLILILLFAFIQFHLLARPAPADPDSDESFFAALHAALSLKLSGATDPNSRGMLVDAWQLLAQRAFKTKTVTERLRLVLLASALEQSAGYWSSVSTTNVAAMKSVTNAVSLLEMSHEILAAVPAPRVFANVPPPAVPGTLAAGQDPGSILDPDVRAEYERRIAENKRRGDLLIARIGLERAKKGLELVVRRLLVQPAPQGSGISSLALANLIERSHLPVFSKSNLLGGVIVK
jgi:hypothetical protein